MDQGRIETGAVILAAGLSSRFGTRSKALAKLGGRSLLQTVVDKCRLVGISRVIVVTGYHKKDVSDAARSLGVATVHNPDYEQGMLSSIKAGIKEMEGTEVFFIWPVDAALTHVQTLLALIAAWRRSRTPENRLSVIVPAFNSFTGHPPLFSNRCRDKIAAWEGAGGLRGWMGSLMNEQSSQVLQKSRVPTYSDRQVSFINVLDKGVISDIDTPEDLAEAHESAGLTRPGLEEAWQLLLQYHPGPEKINHCFQVGRAAFRLAQALQKADVHADPMLALLGGLLHDIVHGRKQHSLAGMALAENLGWPEIAKVIGAHTDLPTDLLRCSSEAACSVTPLNDVDQATNLLTEACLAVYLADKYFLGSRLVDLKTRFEASRRLFPGNTEALNAIAKREQIALAVENRFRKNLSREPLSVVTQAADDDDDDEVAAKKTWNVWPGLSGQSNLQRGDSSPEPWSY